MSYVIAAYALVVGTLALYGWRLHRQRRELLRRPPAPPPSEPLP